MRLLFVGVNPGLAAVAKQVPFAGRGNRFYRALHVAGITDHVIETAAGLDPADREHLLACGIGITSLVARATASAEEVETTELLAGATALRETVARVQPRVVAILGITSYRVAFQQHSAGLGRQPNDLAGAQLWVVPNPSGRNARASVTSLAAAYRDVAAAAGLRLVQSRDEPPVAVVRLRAERRCLRVRSPAGARDEQTYAVVVVRNARR